MSDQDTTVTAEETIVTDESTPKPSRFKNALNKVAPFAPVITTAVVVGVGSLLILKSLEETKEEEVEIIETEVPVVTVETTED